MSRYIDADKLLKNWCESICKPKPNCGDDCFVYDEITNAPTADVRENVRGKWIPINGAYQWECSNCGERIGGDADCTPYINKFCWNCGAKMDEGREKG